MIISKQFETLDDAALRLMQETVMQMYDAVRVHDVVRARVLAKRLQRICAYLEQSLDQQKDELRDAR